MTSSKKENTTMPIHSFQKGESFISVKEIQHKNPYDFTREHRHTYFEVFLFETGGGNQLIDFNNYPIKKQSCYIVFPGQVHLMNRKPEAIGFVIQFNEEIISSTHLKVALQKILFNNNGAVIFENKKKQFNSILASLSILKENVKNKTPHALEISKNFLQGLLLQLMDNYNSEKTNNDKDKSLLYEFQELLEKHFCKIHLVSKYAAMLNINEKKLSFLTKKHLGLTPLQLIHTRLILETKRILLFQNISHKEIAYNLGFDSPATFSQFIKTKTGYSPSELYSQLVEIHK